MPGTKLRFYTEFLKFQEKYLKTEEVELVPCVVCGQPTAKVEGKPPVCAFCKMIGRKPVEVKTAQNQ